MMRASGVPCPTSVAVGRGLAELVGQVAVLGLTTLGGGVSVVRNIVEGSAWGQPLGSGGGCACGCCTVRHHYCYTCVPPCGGCGGC